MSITNKTVALLQKAQTATSAIEQDMRAAGKAFAAKVGEEMGRDPNGVAVENLITKWKNLISFSREVQAVDTLLSSLVISASKMTETAAPEAKKAEEKVQLKAQPEKIKKPVGRPRKAAPVAEVKAPASIEKNIKPRPILALKKLPKNPEAPSIEVKAPQLEPQLATQAPSDSAATPSVVVEITAPAASQPSESVTHAQDQAPEQVTEFNASHVSLSNQATSGKPVASETASDAARKESVARALSKPYDFQDKTAKSVKAKLADIIGNRGITHKEIAEAKHNANSMMKYLIQVLDREEFRKVSQDAVSKESGVSLASMPAALKILAKTGRILFNAQGELKIGAAVRLPDTASAQQAQAVN
jgi:hypothetical protein